MSQLILEQVHVTLAGQGNIGGKHQLLVLLIIFGVVGTLGLGVDAKNGDSLNTNASVILKGTAHAQLALAVLEVDLRCGVDNYRFAIIEVQRTLSLAVKARGDDEVEALLAQRSSGVGAFDALGVDDATLVVHLDVGEFNFSRLVLGTSADGLASGPLVEDIIGQVVLELGAVLLGNGAYKDTISVEELEIDGVGVLIVGVVEEQRVESRGTSLVLLVDGGVDVINCYLLVVIQVLS